jgi:D-aminoacyl-tRNA deacylase
MRAVVQRVTHARVTVEGHPTCEIGAGLVVLVAVGRGDSAGTAAAMAEKILQLRIFNDEQGKMNLSLLETHGALLAVSQFTLYGDARGQRRPSFVQAAPPEQGKALYEEFVVRSGSSTCASRPACFKLTCSLRLPTMDLSRFSSIPINSFRRWRFPVAGAPRV